MAFKYFNVKNGIVTGNILLHAGNGNVSANTFLGNINVTASANLGNAGNVKITGGTNGYVLSTDGSGNLAWVAQSSGGPTISNGNSNINIATANGNITMSAVGNANVVVVTGTGVNIAGTLNATGNITAGNIVTGGGTGGNITGANVISANTLIASESANLGNAVTANFFIGSLYGTANLATYATTANSVAGANVSGQVANALVAGTVYTAAQPNITSVGTLTGITSTGTANFIGASNVSLGPVANVHITGGTTGQYLQTDGSGTLSWSTVTSGSTSNISNGNSNVNIATANGNITLSAVGNANVVVVTGTGVNIEGTLNATGNITAGNIVTGGGTGGNITGANVISANTFTASGNISAGNATLGNAVTANYFIGSLYGTANLATYATTANSVAGGNVSGQVSNALVAGTVYTNAQPNITSVGTLTDLSVSGNAVISGNLVVGGNTTYINVETVVVEDPIIELGSGVNGAPLTSNDGKDRGTLLHYYTTTTVDAFMGWDNSNGEFAFGSNVSVSSDVVTFNSLGNVRASYFIGNGSQLTGINAATSANANYANYAGTAFSVDGSNVSGQVANALVAGTVYTNAQPNITSTGTLTELTVTGNTALSGANVSLGSISNLHITGGTANYVLQTDGAGNLSWAEQASSSSLSSITNDFTGDGTNTAFTLSSTPTDANYTFVSVAGLFEPRTTYTVSGNVITFSEAPPDGAPVEVTVLGGGGGGGGGGGITAQDLLSPFLLMGA